MPQYVLWIHILYDLQIHTLASLYHILPSAGAVILPKDCEILYLNDSKKLSAAKREELYDEIMEKAVAAAVGMASPARIDEINILPSAGPLSLLQEYLPLQ